MYIREYFFENYNYFQTECVNPHMQNKIISQEMASFKILSTCAQVEYLHNIHKALISRLECLTYTVQLV